MCLISSAPGFLAQNDPQVLNELERARLRKGFGVDGLGGEREPIFIDKDQAGGSEGQLGDELEDSTRFRHWSRGMNTLLSLPVGTFSK